MRHYTDYTTIKIPNELITQVDNYMKQNKQEGYTTRVEVIKHAIRTLINGTTNKKLPATNGEESRNGESGGN